MAEAVAAPVLFEQKLAGGGRFDGTYYEFFSANVALMSVAIFALAMLLSTQAGFDARSPLGISQDPQQFAGKLQRDFKGTRFGWLGDYNGYLPMEAGIMDLCQSALKSFEAIGCTVEPAQPWPVWPATL